MYNGIGLQTPRGSGSNGYIQTNKFFIKPKSGKVSLDHSHGFGAGEGTAGLSKKPNMGILEHDRKRQIEVKLLLLEEKLIEQGCTESHIAQKLSEARLSFQSHSAAAPTNTSSAKKFSETETHQIALRKEKQLEKFRAALGISPGEDDGDQDKFRLEENNSDDRPRVRRPFLDREIRSRHEDEEGLHEEVHTKIDKAITSKKRDTTADIKNREDFYTGHNKKKSRKPKNKYSDDSSDSGDHRRHTKREKM